MIDGCLLAANETLRNINACTVRRTTMLKVQPFGGLSPPNKQTISTSTTSAKRMSVSLSGDAARLLTELAEAQGITQNEALRKAIATEAYLRREMAQGAKVLLQDSNKDVREVVFR
jgi:hypothetical protein